MVKEFLLLVLVLVVLVLMLVVTAVDWAIAGASPLPILAVGQVVYECHCEKQRPSGCKEKQWGNTRRLNDSAWS